MYEFGFFLKLFLFSGFVCLCGSFSCFIFLVCWCFVFLRAMGAFFDGGAFFCLVVCWCLCGWCSWFCLEVYWCAFG